MLIIIPGHGECEVARQQRPPDDVLQLHTEVPRHGPGEALGGGGGEAEDGPYPELLSDDFAQSEIRGPEVVGPVTHTVGLVNADERYGRQEGEEGAEHAAATRHGLRGHEEEVELAAR